MKDSSGRRRAKKGGEQKKARSGRADCLLLLLLPPRSTVACFLYNPRNSRPRASSYPDLEAGRPLLHGDVALLLAPLPLLLLEENK